MDWTDKVGRYAPMRTPALILRTLVLPAYGNSRVLPQQSVTMYSNASDIESVIMDNESERGEYLRAVSIPVSERANAMKELELMGITWGSMFPGLDGVCKQLKLKHFIST